MLAAVEPPSPLPLRHRQLDSVQATTPKTSIQGLPEGRSQGKLLNVGLKAAAHVGSLFAVANSNLEHPPYHLIDSRFTASQHQNCYVVLSCGTAVNSFTHPKCTFSRFHWHMPVFYWRAGIRAGLDRPPNAILKTRRLVGSVSGQSRFIRILRSQLQTLCICRMCNSAIIPFPEYRGPELIL